MIRNLIAEDRCEVYLQPIITIKDKKIFAYEALVRAYEADGTAISPITLFQEARKENLTIELDNYVREKAVKKFQKIYKENSYSLLFLNIESSFIDEELKDNLVEITKKYNIPPQNIVIEIKEDAIRNSNYLESFVSFYKNKGFLLAIDDFGTGYSSFDRLSIIRPDIVKIDRSLIYNIQNNYINLQVLKAISSMCHNIGALTLAEGVEEKEEIIACMKNDIDIFQGFWFCKPKHEIYALEKKDISKKIEEIGEEFKQEVQSRHRKKKFILKKIKNIINDRLKTIDLNMKNFDEVIESLLKNYKVIEAIYLLDHETGIQRKKTFINIVENRGFYLPTKEGHDHSLKEYYIITKESSKSSYLGKKYISKASGNSCRTFSSKIHIENKEYILCFDLVAKYILD